jgi:hypothetical protein
MFGEWSVAICTAWTQTNVAAPFRFFLEAGLCCFLATLPVLFNGKKRQKVASRRKNGLLSHETLYGCRLTVYGQCRSLP